MLQYTKITDIECYKLFDNKPSLIWANIYIQTFPDSPRSGLIMIRSDFGSYSYYWSSILPPKEFIVKTNPDVVAECFMKEKGYEYNHEKAFHDCVEYYNKLVKEKAIVNGTELRKQINDNKMQAIQEWDVETPGELRDRLLAQDNPIFEYIYEGGAPNFQYMPAQLSGFMKRVWPDFVEIIKNEING